MPTEGETNGLLNGDEATRFPAMRFDERWQTLRKHVTLTIRLTADDLPHGELRRTGRVHQGRSAIWRW